MRSDHLVDPELRGSLATLPKNNFTARDLADIRAELLERLAKANAAPQDSAVVIADTLVPHHGAPDVPVRIFMPANVDGPLPVLIDIHGGGFVKGSVGMNNAFNRHLALELRCVVISVEYRLAPETPAPGAVEDCYAVLRWIAREAPVQGYNMTLIGLFGRSAGGGLAACLALLTRDRGEFAVAFQALLWPVLDDRTCVTLPEDTLLGEFYWTPEDNHFGWTSLLGTAPGGDGVSSYAAAARASSLAGLPPTFIAVPSLDLLVGENVDYARRLIDAGVPTELHVYPGAFHGFSRAVPGARVSRACERDLMDALRRALHG